MFARTAAVAAIVLGLLIATALSASAQTISEGMAAPTKLHFVTSADEACSAKALNVTVDACRKLLDNGGTAVVMSWNWWCPQELCDVPKAFHLVGDDGKDIVAIEVVSTASTTVAAVFAKGVLAPGTCIRARAESKLGAVTFSDYSSKICLPASQ